MKQSTPQTPSSAATVIARASSQSALRSAAPAFTTDMQGADLESLSRFKQALPDTKPVKIPVAKKKDESGEEVQAAEGSEEQTISEADGEVWELAQAAVAGGAEAAAEGGAAGGAGVGAGTASNLLSPLLLTPLLLVPSMLDTDPAPAPTPSEPPTPLEPAPAPAPAPSSAPAPSPIIRKPTPVNREPEVLLEHDEVKLVLNADSGEIECAVVSGTDPDNGPAGLSFLFWNNGKPSTLSANGHFSIDENGVISLTELGAQSIGAGNPALPCAPSIELEVVAFDGRAYSTPKTLTIDRVLPTFLAAEGESPEGVDAKYSVQNILTDGYAGNAEVHLNAPDEAHISINDFDGGLDLIDFDGWDQAGVALHELEMSRHGDRLHIEVEGADGLEVYLSVANQFAAPVEGEPGAVVEFVHFEQGTTYARYDLGGSEMEDDTWSCEGESPYFQDHGVYLLSTERASADGDTVNGTSCNDVVVGSSEFKEVISGGAGNDLLFSQGTGDTLVGGTGDDLIVLDEEDHEHDHKRDHCEQTTVQFETAATNGLDTIVGFDEETTHLQLQSSDTSFALDGDDVEVFTEGALLEEDLEDPTRLNLVFTEDEASPTAVVALDAASPWNLHTWLGDPSSPVQDIVVDGASAGFSLFFLVEESPLPDMETFTHLYQAADADSNGSLSANEFTHMAQFAGVGVDAFSSSTFLSNNLVPPPPPMVI